MEEVFFIYTITGAAIILLVALMVQYYRNSDGDDPDEGQDFEG
jgi:NADH:ubiquinone oxidoreductase subunit K